MKTLAPAPFTTFFAKSKQERSRGSVTEREAAVKLETLPPWVLLHDFIVLCSKGISASALPYKRTPPSWLKISSQDVEENICKFAKKGLTPSQIGVILRDSHGIAQVKSVTGSKILRILKAHGLAPEIPEDLYHLIKKAVAIRKHLERNRKDKDSKFRLILVESRIHRLARYYKKTKKLPPVWK
ncbi:hypothetical protein GOBAR_DD15985 [Gossypium barbadense]|nr:hypothetical protein GOBAR_DD15985 [Gossypium barbadense]